MSLNNYKDHMLLSESPSPKSNEEKTKTTNERAMEYILDGKIQHYVAEKMSNGSFPTKKPGDTRDRRSINYFREESRELLELFINILSKDYSLENVRKGIKAISDLVGEDSFESTELAEFFTTFVIFDCERIHNKGYNLPQRYWSEIEERIKEKKELINEIKENNTGLEGLENRSIADLKHFKLVEGLKKD